MARWVNYAYNRSNGLILSVTSVGDHLAPVPTPVPIMDTAYFANSAHIMAKAAAILGRKEDAEGYDKLYHAIADAFVANFVAEDGTIQGDTQTDYIIALKFGLLPEKLRPLAMQKLAANVERTQHLTTGFPGTGLLNPMLTQIGRLRPRVEAPLHRHLSFLAVLGEKWRHDHLGNVGTRGRRRKASRPPR